MAKRFGKIEGDRYADESIRELNLRIGALKQRSVLADTTVINQTIVKGEIAYPPFVEPDGGPGAGIQNLSPDLYYDYWLRSDSDPYDSDWHYHEWSPGASYTESRRILIIRTHCYGQFEQVESYVPEIQLTTFFTGQDPGGTLTNRLTNVMSLDVTNADTGPVPDDDWGQRYTIAPDYTNTDWSPGGNAPSLGNAQSLVLRSRHLWACSTFPVTNSALVHVLLEWGSAAGMWPFAPA